MQAPHWIHSARRAALALPAALSVVLATLASAQTFTKITEAANPIVADFAANVGCSWVDYDGDGRDDLFVNSIGLYRNLGSGSFEKIPSPSLIQPNTHGSSWADYDGDGDLDCFIAGALSGANPGGSWLGRNDGGGVFTKVLSGVLGDTLQNLGWSCAWGDYDRDGDVDLVLASPFGFGTTKPNRLFRNRGDGTLEYDLSTDVTNGLAPYTAATWCDFDLDGDLDLYIGSGPANGTTAPDYVYRNQTAEGLSPRLKRITDAAFATNARDGQVGNFVDYDNDGDLDLYVANWVGSSGTGMANDFYRNLGGILVKQTGAQVGPIATDIARSLTSVWGDYDNDGDLDCLVVNAGGAANKYYRNRGDGTFEAAALGTLTSDTGMHWDACNADHDGDGDLDLYVSGTTGKALFRNDTMNGNHWLELRLIGEAPNTSAIGARVRLKATVGGVPVWQMREVSSANTFGGQNSLKVHFGLGSTASPESLIVIWPDGLVETTTAVPQDTCLSLAEGSLSPTPAMFSPGSAVYDGGRVALEWWVYGADGGGVTIERTADDRWTWTPLGVVDAESDGRVRYVDTDVVAGRRYGYRIGVVDHGAMSFSGAAWVVTPSLSFGLENVAPSPARAGQPLTVAFVLSEAADAHVEVIDVRGRVVLRDDLQALAPGRHVVPLLRGGRWQAGLYFIRLTSGDRQAKGRLIVVP